MPHAAAQDIRAAVERLTVNNRTQPSRGTERLNALRECAYVCTPFFLSNIPAYVAQGINPDARLKITPTAQKILEIVAYSKNP